MNAKEKQWLFDVIRNIIIDNKEIHNYTTFRIKVFTNEKSPKIPVHIEADDDNLIFFSVLNIFDEEISELVDINYDGFSKIQLGHELGTLGLINAPKYILNKDLSSEIDREILGI